MFYQEFLITKIDCEVEALRDKTEKKDNRSFYLIHFRKPTG